MIDPEKLKTLYLEMLSEAGVKIMLYTFACDVIMEENIIKGVSVVNKSGVFNIYANAVIDASGDGDIAYKSGAEYFKGREADGKMQPVTIMFKVGGVDYGQRQNFQFSGSDSEPSCGRLQPNRRTERDFSRKRRNDGTEQSPFRCGSRVRNRCLCAAGAFLAKGGSEPKAL